MTSARRCASNRIPYTDLAQNVADADRVGEDPRRRRYRQGLYRAAQAFRARGRQRFGGFSGLITSTVDHSGDNGIVLKVTDAGLTQRMSSAIEASIETIRRRVDAFGTTEPSIQRQGRNRVLVQVPGISDVERLKKLIGETGKLEFKLVDPSANAAQVAESKQVPPDDELLYSTRNAARCLT